MAGCELGMPIARPPGMGRRSAPAVGAGRGRRLGTAVDDPGRLATCQRPAAAGDAAGDAVVLSSESHFVTAGVRVESIVNDLAGVSKDQSWPSAVSRGRAKAAYESTPSRSDSVAAIAAGRPAARRLGPPTAGGAWLPLRDAP